MCQIFHMYDEVPDRRGPLDPIERAAAVTICDRAKDEAEATELLAMFGLLRKGGAR